MTVDQVKMEFAVLQVMAKKLVSLSEDQRKRVLNALLKMVCGEEDNYQQEIKALSFCVNKIEKMGKEQASSNVKFLVDRFYAPRELEAVDSEDASENELVEWDEDMPK